MAAGEEDRADDVGDGHGRIENEDIHDHAPIVIGLIDTPEPIAAARTTGDSSLARISGSAKHGHESQALS
jgi:hypothetical protein